MDSRSVSLCVHLLQSTIAIRDAGLNPAAELEAVGARLTAARGRRLPDARQCLSFVLNFCMDG